jgi:hypothetical protein
LVGRGLKAADNEALLEIIFGIFGSYKRENVRILNAQALTA